MVALSCWIRVLPWQTQGQQGHFSGGCGDVSTMAAFPGFPECLNKLEQQYGVLKTYEVEGTKLPPAGGENEKIIRTSIMQ